LERINIHDVPPFPVCIQRRRCSGLGCQTFHEKPET
jgi:hypothetical protein